MQFDVTKPSVYDALSLQELELYHLIMDYRADQGLAAIPLSVGLTATGGRHAGDTLHNIWDAGLKLPSGANLHSWSDAPYFSDHSEPEVMWEAPSRYGTGYPGYGFEISAAGYSTIEAALDGWKSSSGHNAVILNEGIWADQTWNSIGIGVEIDPTVSTYGGRIYHVWFGREPDPNGSPDIVGTAAADTITGTGFDDRMFGGGGIDLLRGGSGSDTLRGGPQGDRLIGGGGRDDIFGGRGPDVLRGGGGDDKLSGGSGNDVLKGETGSDILWGGPGNDALLGGAGNDILKGGGGRDVLNGGGGRDNLIGGTEADRFVFAPGDGTAVVRDFEDDIDCLDLTAFGFGAANEAKALASNVGTELVFEFAGGEQLVIENYTTAQLAGDDLLV